MNEFMTPSREIMEYYSEQGYQVGTGSIYNKDVDFVARKNEYYIGVETKLLPTAEEGMNQGGDDE